MEENNNENLEMADPVKEVNEPVETVSNPSSGPDYGALVNRILTSLLSGLIGSALLLFGFYFGAQLLGQSLGIDGQFSLSFLMLSLLTVFVSLYITQLTQMYFDKLIEKELYTGLGRKLFVNFVVQIVLLVLVFPFMFIFLAISKAAVAVTLGVYFVFSLILSAGIRESGLTHRLMGNVLGLFVASLISMWIFYGLDESQILLVIIVLPISLILSAVGELVAEVGVDKVNK